MNSRNSTGCKRIRADLEELFGKEVIDRTSEIWGIDEHGELRIGYRPSGQPGVRDCPFNRKAENIELFISSFGMRLGASTTRDFIPSTW